MREVEEGQWGESKLIRISLRTENYICPQAIHSFILTAGKLLFGLVLFCLMVEAPLLTFISALGTLKALNFDLEIFSCYDQAPASLPRVGSRPQAEATVACPPRRLLPCTGLVIQHGASACL